ncbi:MAG: MarR family transcriptional regulator [Nocardioides sp.]|uniref:MarR family winged helix-turn-helix transcriptional regulator n=1 Tax=Nocardioides sp. TaxID=35761 RepID=UPI003264C577
MTAPGLGLLARQLEHQLRRSMAEPLAALDITAEQWGVMAVLLDRPGQTMSALADAAVLPGGTLTRHIDRLVERGLVVRRVHPGDRRRVTAALSPTGQVKARRLRATEVGVEELLRERVGADVFDRAIGLLRALLG